MVLCRRNQQTLLFDNKLLCCCLRVCVPGCIFGVPNFSLKIAENFLSRASKTSHFPSRLIPEHSRLPTSRPVLVPNMKPEFPNLNYICKFKTFPRNQYWTGNFLLGTEICYIKQNQTKPVNKKILACYWIMKKITRLAKKYLKK